MERRVLPFLFLIACESSNIPPESDHFRITVSALEGTGTYSESFEYYLSFDASSALIFIGEDAFARGTYSGCNLTYQSVVVGQDTAGGSVKWQLTGEAQIEAVDGDPCVDGDDDWAGTEEFEIVASDDESILVGDKYQLETHGSFEGLTE